MRIQSYFTGSWFIQGLGLFMWLRLSDFDKRNLEIVDNVAVYPMTHVVVGDEKRAFVGLMPAVFGEDLRPFRERLKYKAWSDRINLRRWKPPVNSRVDANAIRESGK